MFAKSVAIALVLSSVASASPTLRMREDKCTIAYDACVAAGTAEVICSCDRTACYGEDAARIREWCSSQIALLPKSTSTATSAAAFSSISGIPGGCNPAHPGSCPTPTSAPAATFSSISGIPGGCNPAHPGSCPTPSAGSQPAAVPTPTAAPCPAVTGTPNSSPKPVEGKTWTVSNLIRYCIDGNSGCDYNFDVTADGKTEHCTVIRMPGSNAATESWANQSCGTDLTVSWGYAAQPAPAFAVITVSKCSELAWFGVSDVNGGKVSPSSPFGSGDFGTLPASPVYTYY
ncbi:hypothetical protein BKA58DRAFT_233390 [Alternaria rosae]|uniref:uncharacterized protein n=1 Tax=Alternaria rosae TaxID=1187941 RepID=UPI001E8D1C3F|nr:uncharacterized protein BKA58DRAFT_233390 [Alternaria rosae]KAH6864809.1 hypothetical protein BKA58DRAFT_233390 [Alternaria rosae]